MIASTTAVLMSHVNEDEHQSMAAEVSNLTSQLENLRQENTELKLRVQLKDLQAEVAGLRRENSMLQRKGKAADGDFKFPVLVYLTKDTKYENTREMKGLIGYVEEDQRENGEYGDGNMLDGSVNVNFMFAGGGSMFEVPAGNLALLKVGQEVKLKGNLQKDRHTEGDKTGRPKIDNSFINGMNTEDDDSVLKDWLSNGINWISQGTTFIIKNLDDANKWEEKWEEWPRLTVTPKGHEKRTDGTERQYIVFADYLVLPEA